MSKILNIKGGSKNAGLLEGIQISDINNLK